MNQIANRFAGLKIIASSWSTLRAWQPVDMRRVRFVFKSRRGFGSTGVTRLALGSTEAEVVVRLGEDEADGLATLLHELAHVAAERRGQEGHGMGWRTIFRDAIAEVAGEWIPDQGGNTVLTDLAAEVIRKKWHLRQARNKTTRDRDLDVEGNKK